jgi:hypothetical protein
LTCAQQAQSCQQALGCTQQKLSICQQALACAQQTPPICQQALVCAQQVGNQTRFKLVVASAKNKYSKGSSFTHLPAPNNNSISSFKFIDESASEGASQIILWTPHKLIDALTSEGARFASNFF